MLDLYTYTTPNGRKISILLEELGLPYTAHLVDITKGEQKLPEFLKINPNGRIPAIVDHDTANGKPISVFESGAILIYLAEKTGRFLAKEEPMRSQTIEWLMWQMGGIGPMFGQLTHFAKYAPEKIPYAIERYQKEAVRLLGVMDEHLSHQDYFAGDYSIADIAIYPWIAAAVSMQPATVESFKHVSRWHELVAARPAVKKGMMVPNAV